MTAMKIGIVGAGGVMGRMLIQAVARSDKTVLVGATDRPGTPHIGKDAGLVAGIEALDVPITEDAEALFAAAETIIDFTAPAASLAPATAPPWWSAPPASPNRIARRCSCRPRKSRWFSLRI